MVAPFMTARARMRGRGRSSGWCVATTAQPPRCEVRDHENASAAPRRQRRARSRARPAAIADGARRTSRASPMRRRWPCDSTRAGNARCGTSATAASAASTACGSVRRRPARPARQVLLGRQFVLQRGQVTRKGDLQVSARCPGRHRFAAPGHRALVRSREAGEHAQKRGLACPVGARHQQRVSRLDAQREAGKKAGKAAPGREVGRFEHGWNGLAFPRARGPRQARLRWDTTD